MRRYGYRVVNSLIGTLPSDSDLNNMDNCINAVKKCDLFFGIIHTDYGTGNIGGKNITREEFRTAVSENKQRWAVVDEVVLVARNVINHLCLTSEVDLPKKDRTKIRDVVTMPRNSFLDIECIDFYDEMIQNEKSVEDRTGNWVQPYASLSDILRNVKANLYDNKKEVMEKLEKAKCI